MPKRSNEFQRLVYLVRLNLAEGATVTESKMMRDRLTKRFREVDVVIQGKVGSQPVVVCIECRDHKRVTDVTWVDMMKTKHDRLNTNALLLASASGFTKEAVDVARKYGIELITLENQETADFASMLGPSGSLWHKTVSLSVEKVSIRVAKVGDLEIETVISTPDNLVYREDGTELCQARDLVDRMLKSDRARGFFLAEGKEDHVWFEIRWEPPSHHDGKPLYMMKLSPKVLRAIECIRVTGPCKIEIGKFGMRRGTLGTVQVAWGKSVIQGREALAVATMTETGEKKLSISFKGAA
jgi:hypothetical protein